MPSLLDFLFDPQGRSELLGGFLPPDSKWPFEGAGPRNTGTSAADIDDPTSAYNRGLLGDVLGRPQMAAQLMDPRVRDRLIAYTQAEVGNQGPEAQQAFIESSLNRAVARGQPLPQTLSGSYFPDITHSRAMRPVTDAARAQYGPIIDAVLGGSNITQFGTGNASGTVGFAGGPQTAAFGGERFGIEGPDRGWQDRGRGGLPPEILFGQSAPQPGLPPGASAYDAPAGSTAISGTQLPPAAAGRPPTRISIDPRTRTSGPLVAPGGSAMPPGGPALPGGGPQAPQGGPGGPGIGDRLTAALTGFTYAGGLPEALGNVIMGLGTGQRQDARYAAQQAYAQKQQQQTSDEGTLLEALLKRGVPPSDALAAIRNPEVLKTLLPQTYADPSKPPETKEFETPDGGKVAMQWDRARRQWVPVAGIGGGAQPTNPYSLGPKVTETQAKDRTYADRMHSAERILRESPVTQAAQSVVEHGLSLTQGYYNLNSPEYQKFDQAKRNFINATLRRESGAVISPSEFENAEKQYFPLPGDSAAVLKQKQQNRVDAIKGISGGAGPRYKPPYAFDEAGGIVGDTALPPEAPKGAADQTPADYQPKRGDIIKNPKTGERKVWDGQKWITMKPPAAAPGFI